MLGGAQEEHTEEEILSYLEKRQGLLDGVCITGGEPLMRADLEKCGRAIYDRGFPWGMVTNGLAMTPARFKRLLERPVLKKYEKIHKDNKTNI